MDSLRNIIHQTLSEAFKRKHYTTWKKLVSEYRQDIDQTVEDIVTKVTAQLGITKYSPAGSGSQGYAYYIPNNRILKITTDVSEPVESRKIKNKKCKHLANIYDVYTLKGKYDGVYVIICELLQKDEKIDEADDILNIIYKPHGVLLKQYYNGTFDKEEIMFYLNKFIELKPEFKEKYDLLKWYVNGMFNIIDELKANNMRTQDYDPVNLGIKKDGSLAMHDFGYSPNKDGDDTDILQIDESEKQQQTIYVLVGPPSIGKSTYIKNNPNLKKAIIISRDDIVVQVAKKFGLTYDDLFLYPPQDSTPGKEVKNMERFGKIVNNTHPTMKEEFPLAYENILKINSDVDNILSSKFSNAIQTKKDVVIDMTNMSKKSRELNLKPLEGHNTNKVAIVFNFQDKDALDVISKSAEKRTNLIKKQGGSKTITPEILKRIIGSYEPISPDEGFNKIINIDTLSQLRQIDEEAENMARMDYPDFLDTQYNQNMGNSPYPPKINLNRAPMRETELSPEELNKKNLPIQHHNLWSEFLQANKTALGDILPTLRRQYSNVETLKTIKELQRDNPALYDQFANWIFNHIKK